MQRIATLINLNRTDMQGDKFGPFMSNKAIDTLNPNFIVTDPYGLQIVPGQSH